VARIIFLKKGIKVKKDSKGKTKRNLKIQERAKGKKMSIANK
jgi:hypothetical protein